MRYFSSNNKNKSHILIASGLLISLAKSPALESRYVSFSESSLRRCTIANIRKPSINICLSGQATGPDLERAKTWSTRASLTWLRVMKVLDEKVTRQIVFTCTNPHLTIYLRPGGGTSHATPSNSTIYLSRPYGTWTHELGHALAGLGDTYQGSAGKCGNEPLSLMCWGAYGPRANPEDWSTLWPDDINGIQANFKKIFPGNTVAPVWAESINLEKPLNLEEPWPQSGFSAPDFKDHRVFVLKGPASVIDYDENTDSIDL